jgi:CubicO group peptidase (beta-lactamase class C family)
LEQDLRAVDGASDSRFAPVREMFVDVVRGLPGTGAAVAAWHDGMWVADLWGGWADRARSQPWRRSSIVQPYSVTKPFAALCALRLVDRGELELDAPVQRYWPEVRAPATVRQVLSHQAGVVALDEPAPTETFYEWERLCALLARQEPAWTPGTAHGESALFYGHLVGELVRRVDGRSLGRFLRDEICGPLDLDFHIGLSPADRRCAVHLTGLDDAFRRSNELGRPALYRRAIGNPPGALEARVVNNAAWRSAEIPAINGHGSARAVAGLYAALLRGELLSSTLLAEATTAQCAGRDRVFGHENAWGLGFGVDEEGFGMGGLGGSFGGASARGGYAFAYMTGTMGDGSAGESLENAFRLCLGLAPLPG